MKLPIYLDYAATTPVDPRVAEKMMQKHETAFIKQHFDAALIKIKSSFRFGQKSDSLLLEDKLLFKAVIKDHDYLFIIY